MEDREVVHGKMVHAMGWSLGVLYADYGLLGYQYPECLQGALNFLIGMLRWIGMSANVNKSKNMTCHQREIRSGMSQEEFRRRSTGEGATYRQRLKRRVP